MNHVIKVEKALTTRFVSSDCDGLIDGLMLKRPVIKKWCLKKRENVIKNFRNNNIKTLFIAQNVYNNI